MFFSLLHTYGDGGLLALRIALGAVFIYHGLPKLKHPSAVAAGIGLPLWFAVLLGLGETLGGLGVLLGFLTELSSLVLAVVMLGALYFKIAKWGMPFSALDKTGWEFDLVLLAAAILLMTMGPGRIAVEAVISGI